MKKRIVTGLFTALAVMANAQSFLYEKIKITPVFMAPLLSLWC